MRPLPNSLTTSASTLLVFILLSSPCGAPNAHAQPTIGGDDARVSDYVGPHTRRDADVASDGTLFSARLRETAPLGIEVVRSEDGGLSWDFFGRIEAPTGVELRNPVLEVAEGVADRVYVAYQHVPSSGEWTIHVAHASLVTAPAAWSDVAALDVPSEYFASADLVADDAFFGGYYLYLAGYGSSFPNDVIYFTRSTDQGSTWETPYEIGPSTSGSTEVRGVRLDVGAGAVVHAGWTESDDPLTNVSDAIQVRRAMNWAGSGLSDWEPIQSYSAADFGDAQHAVTSLAASPTDGTVVLTGWRGTIPGGSFTIEGSFRRISTDNGATWSPPDTTGLDRAVIGDVSVRLDGSEWGVTFERTVAGGERHYYLSTSNDPAASWTAGSQFDDLVDAVFLGLGPVVSQPDRAGRWGMFVSGSDGATRDRWFDSEWFSDTGVPNLEEGFPLALPSPPVGPPLMADFDADPELEIVYTDADQNVHLLSHTGAEADGWPIGVGALSQNNAVAAGDLNGDGVKEIVVGDSESDVYAFAPSGELMPGFPVNLGYFDHTYVAVGPVLPPYPRSIVAAGEGRVDVLSYRGEIQQSWVGKVSQDIDQPPSIGDVDDDGTPDVLVPAGTTLVRFVPDASEPKWEIDLAPETISGPVTLVDLDLDGPREIVVPTSDGRVHAYDDAGNFLWAYDLGSVWPVGRVATAQLLGTSEPELAFTWIDEVHLLLNDGSSHSNYPQSSGQGAGGFLTEPILGGVHWSSSDIIATSSASEGWAFVNIGGVVEGWPKLMTSPASVAAASGDADQDGDNEIVVFTDTEMLMWDVNFPEQSLDDRRWAMAGGDPGRTNCWQCQPALVTAADEPVTPTRVSFSPPSPNPGRGNTVLSFALPVRAGVQLDVYDLRGRRVRQLARRDLPPGRHDLHFDGRDDRGAALASGTYFARLSVRGPGLDLQLTRKVQLQR